MRIEARSATSDDLEALVELYRTLEAEMVGLKPIWSLADALPEPVESAFKEALGDAETLVVLGTLDGVPLGFLLARSEPLLPQAEGERVGVIRLVFTDPEARAVGVGEAMLQQVLEELRARGHRRFDAHVPPGHRHAKNFFEAAGFAARSIVMHHRG